MKKILAIIFAFLFFLNLTSVALADDSFSTDYNVTYSIKNNADTRVNISIVLTNLTSNFYTPSNTLTVGFKDIRNVSASDEQGPITPKITTDEKGSTIELVFNTHTVGINKKINFNFNFDTKEIAHHLGNVWDVNVPGIASQNNFSKFNVSVVYPQTLGKPTFIKPEIPGAVDSIQNNTIRFTKEQLGSSGISLAFGNFQTYSFNLDYHLENTNLFATKTEIALPPQTNYQEVAIESINPRPLNVYRDKDGNWLAQYLLKPSSRQNIKVKGIAKIFLTPEEQAITNEQKQLYLLQKDYWETKNPKIATLAKELNTPQMIYEYVVKNLKYDFSRVEKNSPRLGAVEALNKPNSTLCLEFSDLFIALARAAGIPARGLNGYAYTDNSRQRPLSLVKDVLHAWPEYYDYERKTWIMVDPTWGNTTKGVDYFKTLDFDHFTFVINGVSSSYPVPAGGYKFANNLNSKDVNVAISESFISIGAKLTPEVDISSNVTAGLPVQGSIKIVNNGDTISKQNQLTAYTNKLTPYNQTINIPAVPPYGYILVPISYNKTNLLTKDTDMVRIALDSGTIYKTILISPFFFNKWIYIGGILIVSIILILSITYIGYRRLPFFRQRG